MMPTEEMEFTASLNQLPEGTSLKEEVFVALFGSVRAPDALVAGRIRVEPSFI